MAEQTMTKKKGLKKGWRIVLGILAGLILLYAVLGVLPRRENYALANPMMKAVSYTHLSSQKSNPPPGRRANENLL